MCEQIMLILEDPDLDPEIVMLERDQKDPDLDHETEDPHQGLGEDLGVTLIFCRVCCT